MRTVKSLQSKNKLIIFMKNLQNFGFQKLNAQELIKVDGGRIPWRLFKKWRKKIIAWAGVNNTIDDFSARFLEGNCY
jgi:hypothetical protein